MTLTFQQFAEKNNLSLRGVRYLAQLHNYKKIIHNGIEYNLVRIGRRVKQWDQYAIDDRNRLKNKHLTPGEKSEIKNKLEHGADAKELALKYNVSLASVYRVKEKQERSVRSDAGEKRIGLPPNAQDIFNSAYIANAQKNARLAYEYAVKQLGGFYFPYKYALEWAKELNALHSYAHYASRFESAYNAHIRRDLWGEYEFMQQVVWDVWKADDWVIYKGKDVQPRIVLGIELKTGLPVAWKAFPHDPNAEDINSVMLEFVYKWGVPETILLDNGREFKNESVLRFLSGWWNTEKHEVKRRIIFSQAYQPRGKGRIERLFRIFKDEFCAFSPSYSPNPKDSRKPNLQLSHVAATKTLKEFCEALDSFINGDLLSRQRTMWYNNNYTRNHPINEKRPRNMQEALDRVYTAFQPNKISTEKLAFLYAKKFRKQLRNASFKITYAGERFMYLPEDLPFERFHETFDILLDPINVGHAWVCDLRGNAICEAWDLRYKNVGLSREQASEAKKLNNRINKSAKKQLKNINELKLVAPKIAKRHIRETAPVENIEETIYKGIKVEEQDTEIDSDYIDALADIYEQQLGESDEQYSKN